MTLVIIAGGFDLSVGAIFAMGVVNGLVITSLKVQSFLTTSATRLILKGFAAWLAAAIATSRVSTGQAWAGLGFELGATAFILGGTSIYGGVGAVW